MKEPIKAAFGFSKFKIKDFSFTSNDEIINNLTVTFDPSGTLDPKTGEFVMNLKFTASHKEEQIISTSLVAYFNIPEAKKIEDLPSYFYKNSIAIVYPYLRSFITTLTIQAGVKPIIMPLLNLSNLEPEFIKNTTLLSKTPNALSKSKKAPAKK